MEWNQFMSNISKGEQLKKSIALRNWFGHGNKQWWNTAKQSDIRSSWYTNRQMGESESGDQLNKWILNESNSGSSDQNN